MVPGGQGVGLQGPRGARGWNTGSQEVNGLPYRVPAGQGVCLGGPRGQGVGLQGPRGLGS